MFKVYVTRKHYRCFQSFPDPVGIVFSCLYFVLDSRAWGFRSFLALGYLCL